MRADVIKTIHDYVKKDKINSRYSISSGQINFIANLPEGLCDKICDAFIFGYAQGAKATKAEMKNKFKEAKAV